MYGALPALPTDRQKGGNRNMERICCILDFKDSNQLNQQRQRQGSCPIDSCHTVFTCFASSRYVNIVNHFGVSVLQDVTKEHRYYSAHSPMLKHVISLQEAGFDISNENLESILEFQEFVDITKHRKICRSELERLNQVRLDAKTTLRDALRVRDPRRLQRLAVNETFGRIVADEAALGEKETKFALYGHLVQLQYRRGARIAEAVLALQKLYACIAKADNGLPPECAEVVVYYLPYEELWRVIQAASR